MMETAKMLWKCPNPVPSLGKVAKSTMLGAVMNSVSCVAQNPQTPMDFQLSPRNPKNPRKITKPSLLVPTKTTHQSNQPKIIKNPYDLPSFFKSTRPFKTKKTPNPPPNPPSNPQPLRRTADEANAPTASTSPLAASNSCSRSWSRRLAWGGEVARWPTFFLFFFGVRKVGKKPEVFWKESALLIL